jgi:hypothetical protein
VKDDLRTLCYEHKKEMEQSGITLKFVSGYKREMCDKCEKLGFTYKIFETQRNKRRER